MGVQLEQTLETLRQNWPDYAWRLLGVVCIFIAAKFSVRIIQKLIVASYARRQASKLEGAQRRLDTASTIMQSMSKYVIWFIAIAGIVGQLGLTATMGSMLAAAGVGGLALGIGAQSFIKDVVAGMFFVFENQMAVGDYVTVAGVTGTVEEITLRTTVLKSYTGEVHSIPNGSITIITNLSRENALAMVDIPISYESDAARAMDCLKQVGEEYAAAHENAVSPPEVWGVTAFGASGLTLRMVLWVRPTTQYATERALRLAARERFLKEGIGAPYDRLLVTEAKA